MLCKYSKTLLVFLFCLVLPLLLFCCGPHKIIFPYSEPNVLFYEWGDSTHSKKIKLLNASSGLEIELNGNLINIGSPMKFANAGKWIWFCEDKGFITMKIYDIESGISFNPALDNLDKSDMNLGSPFEIFQDSLICFLGSKKISTYSLKTNSILRTHVTDVFPNYFSALSSSGLIAASSHFSFEQLSKQKIGLFIVYNCANDSLVKILVDDCIVLNWSPNSQQLLLKTNSGASVMEYPSLKITQLRLNLPDSIKEYDPYYLNSNSVLLSVGNGVDGFNNFYLYDLIKGEIVKQLTFSKSYKKVMDINNH